MTQTKTTRTRIKYQVKKSMNGLASCRYHLAVAEGFANGKSEYINRNMPAISEALDMCMLALEAFAEGV
jgi:hypothetical protein